MLSVKGKKSEYRILEKLGKGGQATVYKAEDTSHQGRLVALKVVYFPDWDLEYIYGNHSYQRFHWEYILTSKLRHPQIATAFDYGTDRQSRLIFMARPYLEGCTVTELLNKEGPLPTKECIRLILSIAGILDYIHSKGVVHCDIKPSNVFMEYDEPLLIDFGLSTGIGVTDMPQGSTSGTPDYIAPEVIDPDQRKEFQYSFNRDWWALGCVAFNMITGKRLFKKKKSKHVLTGIQRGKEQVTIERLLSGHELFDLVSALLERDPEKRVNSKADLEKILKESRLT